VLFGALLGMIYSLLVFQLGQARVWFAMIPRIGLLPGYSAGSIRTIALRIFPRGWPVSWWGTRGLLDIGTLADLSNIGTLFAFALSPVAC